jgi:hypothetical protein
MDPDLDVPPVSSCALCGRFGCPGCAPEPKGSRAILKSAVAFERAELELKERLVQTTLDSVCTPGLMFGRGLCGPTQAAALKYAVLTEGLAVGSLLVVAFVALGMLFPKIASELFWTAGFWWLALGGYVSMVTFLVLVHWFWGLALDFGVAARKAKPADGTLVAMPRQGVRFGLYACGWDLVTSPIGLVLVHQRLPKGERTEAVVGALRAPRIALRAFLHDALGLSDAEAGQAQLRALIVGMLGLLAFLALSIVTALALLWRAEFLYLIS